jgi:hypothetical protein
LDYNKCGQAAVATILDYYGLDPYELERPVYDAHDGGYHWRDDRIIDRIKERFPGAQISRALAHAGLETRVAHSTDVGVGREIWEGVKRLANAGYPVVVILDRGMLGGCPFTAHWGGRPTANPLRRSGSTAPRESVRTDVPHPARSLLSAVTAYPARSRAYTVDHPTRLAPLAF